MATRFCLYANRSDFISRLSQDIVTFMLKYENSMNNVLLKMIWLVESGDNLNMFFMVMRVCFAWQLCKKRCGLVE